MTERAPGPKIRTKGPVDAATDAVLQLSRTLVGVAARSLAATEDTITLVQYRALVMLDARGEQNMQSVAEALGIQPSTATRLCDRLIVKGYIDRTPSKTSRREVTLALSEQGQSLVRAETARRRRAIRRIVERLDVEMQREIVDALGALSAAAEVGPDEAWRLGWTA
jgi:DNA-binding MarR family transcriptional regulator